VRNSDTDDSIADIGMIVSPLYRKSGYGTFLLGKAKEIAIRIGKTPICSCEKDNLGSLKSIQKNGFRSIHQLLSVEFNVDL
jgi:predicted acetyltransferase